MNQKVQTLNEAFLRHCEHRSTRIVWTEFSNYGTRYHRPQLRNYCDDCGSLIGSALKHSLADAGTPTLSREEATRPERAWRAHYEQIEAERQRQTKQWHADYDAYLQSPEWAEKRELVFDRAGGRCEGCRRVCASEVHHLTYAHVFSEFLWELVAICRDCHERFHGAGDELGGKPL